MQPMTPNSFGTQNNVINVKKSDFEAFEALGIDSLETGHYADNYYVKYGMLNVTFGTGGPSHPALKPVQTDPVCMNVEYSGCKFQLLTNFLKTKSIKNIYLTNF